MNQQRSDSRENVIFMEESRANKTGRSAGLALGAALLTGCGLLVASALAAEEKPAAAAPAPAAPAPAAPAAQPAEEVIFADEFNEAGKLGEWVNVNGVTEKDVADGHALMANTFKKDIAEGEDPTTSLIYSIGDYDGNIAAEVKFDDFLPNDNCYLMVNLVNVNGNAVMLSRWSAQKKQTIQFQVVGDGKSKVMKTADFASNSGVMKVQLTSKTGELRAFYKATPDAQYTEMQGSPFTMESFKEGPYTLVLQSFNFAEGGPASVKLDYARVTSPKS